LQETQAFIHCVESEQKKLTEKKEGKQISHISGNANKWSH